MLFFFHPGSAARSLSWTCPATGSLRQRPHWNQCRRTVKLILIYYFLFCFLLLYNQMLYTPTPISSTYLRLYVIVALMS